MKVGRIAANVAAEVALAVGPALAPAGAEEHDGPRGDPAVLPLPGREVFGREAVVASVPYLTSHVDNHRWRDEQRERHLVDGRSPLREVDRRVEVRAAVLRSAD